MMARMTMEIKYLKASREAAREQLYYTSIARYNIRLDYKGMTPWQTTVLYRRSLSDIENKGNVVREKECSQLPKIFFWLVK